MPDEKWKRREQKLHKRKTGMQVSGRSVFTLQEILRRKAETARRERQRTEQSTSDHHE